MKKRLYYLLMFLPVLITVCVLPFLPDQIPAHYGFDNQVTRWGSKYETLIFPVITILMGYFLLIMAKIAAKQESSGKNNENVCIITGIVTLIIFNVMTCYFLYTDFKGIEDLSSVSVNIYQILFGLLGIFMIVVGNIMPKLRMNSLIGLRTPWSLKNEITWKKSQRFGGISFILSGIIIIIISILLHDFHCLLWSMVTIVITTIIDVVYTFRVSLKNQ